MISKQDILDRAAEWGLRPEIVEKDYVLGWLLAGFAANQFASASWIFKGGTCLKKCFFETYRFSEDLDFSLSPSAAYDEASIKSLITEVARYAAEMSGVAIPAERVEVRTRRDKLGRPTYQGKVAYRGPLAMPNWPRVLFDITQHEAISGTPSLRRISHPYADHLPDGPGALCYSLEELFAEKTRALLERTRPRDLYDVAHLWDRRATLDLGSVREIFAKKCAAKNVTLPTTAGLTALVRSSDALRADWGNMMEHQLPSLPALDGMLARLEEILSWIDAPPPQAIATSAIALAPGDTIVAPRGGYYWGGGQRLELVRFAAANRLKIAFQYDGKNRIAEPYSLRRRATGNLVLYAWENSAGTIKSFLTTKMRNVQTTNESFVPRFRVELTG